jgi:hypothetical protein
MNNLQLNQFQELYLNGAFSDVVVLLNYKGPKLVFNISFIHSSPSTDVSFLVSQKNAIRDFKTLDSCLRVLHFVDSFKVEDELYFRARSGS